MVVLAVDFAWPRRARGVRHGEIAAREIRPSSMAIRVDLPQPDGPEMMMMLRMAGALFDVLHLLPDLFDLAADQQDLLVDVQAAGLGGDGMGFALHFLGEEIGFPAHGWRRF